MKSEMLETLLLDRALGELSPEVAALLDAHLAQNPDAARRAAELAGTLQLARAATAAPVASAPHPLDVGRLRRAQRTQRSAARRVEIFRLAACLALGLGLGWLAHAPQPRLEIAAATPHRATPLPAVSPAGFWSVARIVAEEQARRGTNDRNETRYALRWESPTKQPRLEEKP